jgi:hypothetical protein
LPVRGRRQDRGIVGQPKRARSGKLLEMPGDDREFRG